MRDKSNIFGDLPKKPIKQKVEDNRLVERVEHENLYPFKKGSFENYEDYKKRLTDSFQYNISIGTVTLNDKNYDVETKKFFVNIQYEKWFQQLSSLETSNRFYIEIEPSEAQSLYYDYDYESYELVAQFELDCECGIILNMDTKVKVLLKKMWLIAKARNVVNDSGFKGLIKDKQEEVSFQEYFKNTNNMLCSKIEIMSKLKDKKLNKEKEFEDRLWNKALEKNTRLSYENYLDNTKNYIYYLDAVHKYEQILNNDYEKITYRLSILIIISFIYLIVGYFFLELLGYSFLFWLWILDFVFCLHFITSGSKLPYETLYEFKQKSKLSKYKSR